jgi:hypothetical protein
MSLPSLAETVLPGDIRYTPPVIGIIVANFVTIILAVLQDWDTATILFIFFGQNLIIGFFAVISMLTADTRLLVTEKSAAEAAAGKNTTITYGGMWRFKIAVAVFFIIHYGLFNLFYYVIIFWNETFGPVDYTGTAVRAGIGFFLLCHLLSFLWYRGKEKRGVFFMAAAVLQPYNRIIPLHLTMIIGGTIAGLLMAAGITTVMPVLVVFLLLKMYLDVRLHLAFHGNKAHPEKPVYIVWFGS